METDTQTLLLHKTFKMPSTIFQVQKRSLRCSHAIHFGKLYYVQKPQTKSLFKYISKYTFLQSKTTLNCLLVMAQRRLGEYTLLHNVISWKTLYVRHFLYVECHLEETSSELALMECGKSNQWMYGLAVSASVQFVTSKLKGGPSEQTQQESSDSFLST